MSCNCQNEVCIRTSNCACSKKGDDCKDAVAGGAIWGTGIGACVGGPPGALIGAVIGSVAGALLGCNDEDSYKK